MARQDVRRRASGRRTRRRSPSLFVVDADVHVHEDPAELAEFAEPPWDVALREIAKVEERYLDLPGHVAAGGVPHPLAGRLEPPQIVATAGDDAPRARRRCT